MIIAAIRVRGPPLEIIPSGESINALPAWEILDFIEGFMYSSLDKQRALAVA